MSVIGSEKIQVVGVCYNEAMIYDVADGYGYRKLVERKLFSNNGQALQFAVDFETKQRTKRQVSDDVEVKRKSRKQLKDVQQ